MPLPPLELILDEEEEYGDYEDYVRDPNYVRSPYAGLTITEQIERYVREGTPGWRRRASEIEKKIFE